MRSRFGTTFASLKLRWTRIHVPYRFSVNNIRDHTSTTMCVGLSDLTCSESGPNVSPADVATSPVAGPPDSPDSKTPKRVLLLEDDSSFREIITTLLTESGYEVRAVQSGVEGIQEVLAGDFAVILCDMMMPGLPGDLFFYAVDRARPHLCERFVFMTGRRGDAMANDFISAVLAPTLLKPFGFQELFDALQEVEQRQVVHGRPTTKPSGRRSTRTRQVSISPAPIVTNAVAKPAVKPGPVVVDPVPVVRLPPVVTESERNPALRNNLSIALLTVSVMALLWSWRLSAEGRSARAWMEARVLEERWNMAVANLEEAKQIAAERAKAAERTKRIIAEFPERRWAAALEKIVGCMTSQMQMEKFQLQQDLDGRESPNRWTLHITAQYPGRALDADYFRDKLKRELDRASGKDIEVVLAKPVLLPAPESAPQESNIRFAIDATNVPLEDPFASPGAELVK